MEKSESVPTPAKDAALLELRKRRRVCTDIEYKRQHGCVDTIDLVLAVASSGLLGGAVGLLIGLAAG